MRGLRFHRRCAFKRASGNVAAALLALTLPAIVMADTPEGNDDDPPVPDVRQAQAKAGQEPQVRESEYFETATVHARPLTQATASVTVIGREEIEALQAATAAELIRFIPGLNLTGGGPRGAVATAQIRGGDPNFTTVLLDGVPLNDSTDQLGGSVSLQSLSTADLERVEVVRGPLSSFFGSAGLAGAVNLITRKGAGENPVVRSRLAGGNGSTVHGAVSLSGAAEGRDYYVGASWEEEEGRVAEDAFDQFSVNANLGYQVGPHASVRVSTRYASWSAVDYREGSGGPVFGSGETRLSDHDELSLGLTWQGGKPGGHDGHRVRATIYRHELSRTSPGVGFVAPPSIENSDYTALALGWSLPVVQADHVRLSVGAEIETEDGENRGSLDLPPMFGGLTDTSYSIDRDSAAAFVEWVVESGPVIFELGARLDVPEGADTELSPRAGIAWRLPNGSTRLSASAGRAFKLPSFFALADAVAGNPDLVPETSTGFDLGVEQRFEAAGLSATLTGFFNRFDDLIDFDFSSFMLDNVGDDVESRGVELGLTWIPNSDVELRVSMTHQEVENRRTGEPLRHRPDQSGSARLIWRATERVRGQVDGQWVSEFPDDQVPVPDRTTVPGTPLYGAGVHVDLSPRFRLGLRIDNLTDRDYETFIGFPGPGRAYRVTLRHTSSR